MEHHRAQASRASERYLLGEMSEAERFEFEAHYFDCAECAEDVVTGDALARGIQAVSAEDAARHPKRAVESARPRRQWFFSWLTPPVLASGACALLFGGVAVWQATVVIPGLRWAETAQAVSPSYLRAEARGEEQTLEVRRNEPVSVVSLDVNAASPGTPLVYEVTGPGGVKFTGSTQAPPAASPLLVMLPNAVIRKNGDWVLVLRATQSGPDLARYPFSVHTN
jgi:anti-sigma factor RsiW